MQGLRDIFALWPTNKAMGEAVGVNADTVRKWKKFKRIPSDSWQAVITAVSVVAAQDITIEQLLAFNAPMKPRGRPVRVRRRQKKALSEARA